MFSVVPVCPSEGRMGPHLTAPQCNGTLQLKISLFSKPTDVFFPFGKQPYFTIDSENEIPVY